MTARGLMVTTFSLQDGDSDSCDCRVTFPKTSEAGQDWRWRLSGYCDNKTRKRKDNNHH